LLLQVMTENINMRHSLSIVRAMVWAVVALGVSNSFAAEEHALLSAPLTRAPGHQLSAITVTYAPGQSSLPHRHSGDVFAYVLSGHIRSQLAGGKLHSYGPGESWFEPAGTHHIVSGNASGTEPATMLVVFVAAPEAEQTTFDQPSPPERTQSR
jgi:quercetin dioxygenase-like cupin family protein